MVFSARIIFIYCLVFQLLIGCTKPQPIDSNSNLSINQQLEQIASTAVVVPKDDETGGNGANFIVEWRAEQTVIHKSKVRSQKSKVLPLPKEKRIQEMIVFYLFSS